MSNSIFKIFTTCSDKIQFINKQASMHTHTYITEAHRRGFPRSHVTEPVYE